jgi:protein involved in polysaccharide export with SLBB domain
MRPGTDSQKQRLHRDRLTIVAMSVCTLLCTSGIGCNGHRHGQTVMTHQTSDVCLSNECSLGEPGVDLCASEFAGMPCESCPPGGAMYDQNQWSGSACSTADCNGNCGSGCQQCGYDLPRELNKVSLPDYVVEPPDILLIEVSGGQKLPNAKLRAGERLHVRVGNTLPVDTFDDPVARAFKQIDDTYRVQPDGTLNFGPEYGAVPVRGLTIQEARRLIELHLQQTLRTPQVYLSRSTDQADQPVTGEHLVRPDGTVSLGIYGSVYVSGSTLSSAQQAIQRHLSGHMNQPEVYIDVLAYNSKVFYIVTDGGGAGEQVFRFPCTGNETVLDALSQINDLPTVASKKDIWIARPAPPEVGYEQILNVDWNGIVRGGQSKTNYQLLPGDRLYVQADRLVTFDTMIARITAPLERVAGFVLLGHGAFRSVQNGHNFQAGGGL